MLLLFWDSSSNGLSCLPASFHQTVGSASAVPCNALCHYSTGTLRSISIPNKLFFGVDQTSLTRFWVIWKDGVTKRTSWTQVSSVSHFFFAVARGLTARDGLWRHRAHRTKRRPDIGNTKHGNLKTRLWSQAVYCVGITVCQSILYRCWRIDVSTPIKWVNCNLKSIYLWFKIFEKQFMHPSCLANSVKRICCLNSGFRRLSVWQKPYGGLKCMQWCYIKYVMSQL